MYPLPTNPTLIKEHLLPYSEICYLTAKELAHLIRNKDISAREAVEAHLAQIELVNPLVNAIVTLTPEQALDAADAADATLGRGDYIGPLHGLPIAHKDLVITKGIRTTYGSPLFKDYIPDQDALIVTRLRQAGAITIGKTNTPEFGAGSQTYNEVFGETLNPYDVTKTCGGSSGGAAVALACRMQPIADGSDTGGSLRNPANFCNVVGFRPSPGRVPVWPSQTGWAPTSVQGPMARTVDDAALMLSVIAGPDPRIPISITEQGGVFADSLDRDFSGTRIAWSRDLGGLPVDPRVTKVFDSQRNVFESMGCQLDNTEPDFSDADRIFKIWRGWGQELGKRDMLEAHRDQMKDTLIWDIEQGIGLTGPEIGWAEVKRMELFQKMHAFMERYEFLICPVSQVPPFDVEQRYVTEINGVKMETFIDWMKSCYFITVTGHPSISVPGGFTADGLPVGIQIVGRYRDDLGVLQLAHAFEQATQTWKRMPGPQVLSE